jgi:hypothetical protein
MCGAGHLHLFASKHVALQVRLECKEGLRRLGVLEMVSWARQLHDLNLWPMAEHLRAVDRKLGGVLTRADILGVEHSRTPEANSGHMESHKLARQDPLHSMPSKCCAIGNGQKRCGQSTAATRIRPLLRPPLDMQNVAFELRRAQAAAVREGRGLKVMLPRLYCHT